MPAHNPKLRTKADSEALRIELQYVVGCPHADAARTLLRECLTELQLDTPIEEKEGDYPSPTILVNGDDVMGWPASRAPACRLDIPTRPRLLAALRPTAV